MTIIMMEQQGQSLVEILVALAVFVLILCAVFAMLGSSFLNVRQTQEGARALILAKEGLEASRSLGDNNWDSLINGNHGLAITNDHWIFQGTEEDISSQLNQGERQVIISDLETDQKLISSKITWQFSRSRMNELTLFTVLSNWQEPGEEPGICQGDCTRCNQLLPAECLDQQGCYLREGGGPLRCRGRCLDCEEFTDQSDCENQQGCQWQEL